MQYSNKTTDWFIWENNPNSFFELLLQQILSNNSPLHNIMSGSMTIQASPSKHNRRSNYSGFAAVGGSAANGSALHGSFAATPNAAGNIKKVKTISPLSAALMLKDIFIELLPFASRPFLTPLAKSALREFACHFYAEKKAKETKSDLNYLSSSAKKLGIVL